MRALKRWLKDNRGFTLAEMITASAVLGLVAAGGSTTYARYMRASQEMDLRDAMTSLRKEVETALTIPANLTRSIGHPENRDFSSCFAGALTNMNPADPFRPGPQNSANQAANCNATDGSKFYPFVLVTSMGGVVSGGTSSSDGQRATTAARILTWRGETCTAAQVSVGDPRCEVELTTAFRAVCPPPRPGLAPADRCATPSTVELFFTVRQLTGGNMFKRGVRFPAMNNMVNPDGTPRDRVDALRVKALDFMRPEIFECPAGQTFKGFDENGKVLCGFQENPCGRLGADKVNWIFERMDTNGVPVCRKPLQGEDCLQATRSPQFPNGDPLAVFLGVNADGTLNCVRPKISDQGCKDGEVLVNFDGNGNPNCVKSVIGQVCPTDKFLVGYDAAGNPRCVDMRTPSGELFTVEGPRCGHNSGVCRFGSANKPDGFIPKCPADTFTVKLTYRGPRCCATCGWVGQWWCDDLVVTCSPYTTAKWQ